MQNVTEEGEKLTIYDNQFLQGKGSEWKEIGCYGSYIGIPYQIFVGLYKKTNRHRLTCAFPNFPLSFYIHEHLLIHFVKYRLGPTIRSNFYTANYIALVFQRLIEVVGQGNQKEGGTSEYGIYAASSSSAWSVARTAIFRNILAINLTSKIRLIESATMFSVCHEIKIVTKRLLRRFENRVSHHRLAKLQSMYTQQ